MWRGYGKNKTPVNVNVNASKFQEKYEGNFITPLYKVFYKEEDKMKLIDELLTKIGNEIAKFTQTPYDTNAAQHFSARIQGMSLAYATSMKHHGFAEERVENRSFRS